MFDGSDLDDLRLELISWSLEVGRATRGTPLIGAVSFGTLVWISIGSGQATCPISAVGRDR